MHQQLTRPMTVHACRHCGTVRGISSSRRNTRLFRQELTVLMKRINMSPR